MVIPVREVSPEIFYKRSTGPKLPQGKFTQNGTSKQSINAPSSCTNGTSIAEKNVSFPCRHPDGCQNKFLSTAELVSHIEKVHWNLKSSVPEGGENGTMTDVECGKSSGNSSNSGEPTGPSNCIDLRSPNRHSTSGLPKSDQPVCPFNCAYDIDEDMEVHIRLCHPDDPFSSSSFSSGPPAPRRDFSAKLNLTKQKHREKRSASCDLNGATDNQKKWQPSSGSQDPDSQTDDISVSLVPGRGAGGNGRYPFRRQTGLDTSAEATKRAAQRDLTVKICRILTHRPDDDGMESEDNSNSADGWQENPLDRLRAIASVLSVYISEFSDDDARTKGGSGYCSSYLERLESLLEDSPEGNSVVSKVGDLLRDMDKDKREYQKPDEKLHELIQQAASNGKKPPKLLMCSYGAFYGKDFGDAGWGCGYRNAQMLISTLLNWPATSQQLQLELGDNQVPNITTLQGLIHRAWARGFDNYAADELGNDVMESSKWIGTTEIFALFSSMKIECVIKDFANGNGDLKQQLFHFVREYFVENLKKGFAAPLYIQYSGHSRTVIGVDVTGLDTPEDPKLMDNVGLLIFDPGQSQWDIKIRGTPTRKWYKNHIYCPVKSFKENTFQILYFTGKILSQAQYEVMKEPGAGHETSAARIYSSSLVTL